MTTPDPQNETRNRRLLVRLLLFAGGLFLFTILYVSLK